MAIRWQPKLPAEARDYQHDWTPFLGTDTILSQVTTASGVTVDSVTLDAGNRIATFRVSGGTTGVATVTQTITSAGGRVESETFILQIGLEEPVSLATAKAHLRVLDDSEDALIEALVVAAREWVENYTGHILVRRTMTQSFDGFSSYLTLHYRPVVTVASIGYFDTAGLAQVQADFAQTTGRYPFRVYPDAQPSTDDHSSVTVTFTAGYAPGEEPQALIQAMLLLIGSWFTTRAGVTETARQEVPLAVHSLCDQYRTPIV